MIFFDVNHWLGSSDYGLFNSLTSNEEKKKYINNIIGRLDDNDIKKVIITSKLALSYDWKTGNDKLLVSNLTEQVKDLYYCFILNPDAYFTYDFKKYLGEAFRNKVRLFRVFPKSQLFYINDYYMKEIFKVLSERKFPVMLDMKQLDITGNKYFDIDILEKILDDNKNMPIILETSLKQCMFSRYYFSLLERFENLYLEVSGLLLYDQIEHYVEKFGSKRLIFGTSYPNLPIEINTNRILLSDMGVEDKNNIAFNNLNDIMGGIEIG